MIKTLDKFENICLIDNVKIYNINGKAVHSLVRYLKHKHNVHLKDYLIKYYFNNQHPKCRCGCGNETSYYKGMFGEYYENHKNLVNVSDETKTKMINAKKENNTIEKRLLKLNKTKEEIKLLYDFFINFTYNLTDITKNYKIDKRTLKKLWLELNLIDDVNDFENICKKHQKIWFNKNNKAGGKQHIEDELLLNVFIFLKENKRKNTLNEIINKFNLSVSSLVLYKRLCENFGETIITEHLKLGLSSKPEIEFYNVLKFYFGNKIKQNFNLEGKFYDFILDKKILIEFDGDYWHNLLKNIENDNLKNEIAKRNGYIIFRVKESECKDITILNKLKLLYETQIQQSRKEKNY